MPTATEEGLSRRRLFVLELCYLALLVGLALLWGHQPRLRSLVGSQLGPVPVAVPWWGALGGITISLTGVFRHTDGWDSSYNLWHIARPVMGAITGSVGYLIFVAVVRPTGAVPSAHSTTGAAVFDLVAFLVGYREEVFRELLRKAVDILLSPGKGHPDGAAS